MCGRYDTDLQLVVCGVGTHGTEDSRFARVWCKLLYVCECHSNMHVSTMRSRQVAHRQDSGGTLTATQPEIHMAGEGSCVCIRMYHPRILHIGEVDSPNIVLLQRSLDETLHTTYTYKHIPHKTALP